jgi:hypothetical protein
MTILTWLRIDLRHRPSLPSPARWALATVVALVGSLAADAALVAMAKSVFPHTRHYPHFQFGDYATLTIIGVVIACLGWPVVIRICTTPRWLFVRLAVLVTLVLWLPDLYLFQQGQQARAVAVLMLMHLAIAVVTYESLVRIAPARVTPSRPAPGDRARRVLRASTGR